MPPNHRTLLCQFIPLLTFPISICSLPTLYFSFSFPSPLVRPVPLHSIFLVPFLCLRKSSLPPPPIHHHRSHPARVPFLLLLTCFHSPNGSHLHHTFSLFSGHLSRVLLRSLFHQTREASPQPSPFIPGRLYFIQPTRPQVGLAVLVRATFGWKLCGVVVLGAQTNGTDGGGAGSGRASRGILQIKSAFIFDDFMTREFRAT